MSSGASALMRCLQLASPSLPIGAYAYSQGLEMAVELGWVSSPATLDAWLRDQIEQSMACVDIPLLARLYDAAARGDETAVKHWSAQLIAQRETRELRADDSARGLALARLLRDLGIAHLPVPPGRALPLATSFACAALHWSIPREAAAEAYAWAWLEGQVLAGVKLIPLGQVAGQRLLCTLTPPLAAAVASGLVRADDEIGGSLPALAIASALHLCTRFPDLDLVLVESGGDNLAATFSPELADLTIYVIDVAEGEKIPRKGGPGITRSDLLVINKTDLAPYVGASLEVMESDTRRMRGTRPYVFTNLRTGSGLETIAEFVIREGILN